MAENIPTHIHTYLYVLVDSLHKLNGHTTLNLEGSITVWAKSNDKQCNCNTKYYEQAMGFCKTW